MAQVNVRALVGKLNPTCRRALEGAAGLCLSRTNYNVEIEHWLLKLLEASDTDLPPIFKHFDVDSSRVQRELTKSLDGLKTGNARAPELSLEVLDVTREAWTVASLEHGAARIRSGHLLAALLADRNLSARVRNASPELGKISAEKLSQGLAALTARSGEAEAEAAAPATAEAGPGRPAADSKTPALDQYTQNLTQRAAKGEIDPVIGRDAEIRQVIDILTRRRQNNPILTGEAGVGKTAVVEGFALRVAAGDVPAALKGNDVRVLDMGLLQAGAGVKGEFENRLKGVITEVKASPKPIILFIDEAHTLIGAGGGGGGGNDAANLLKPALARGELRTIAATTWAEFKKYFETDAALKRRFQVVKVDEPDVERATRMIRGLAGSLEKHHKVRILDEAVDDAVKLSHRYMTERQLPDKAVSLLDTACARVALSQSATPAAVEDSTREIDHLGLEIATLERERSAGAVHDERLAELREKKKAEEERSAGLRKRWEEEKRLAASIQKLRAALEGPAKGEKKERLSEADEQKCRAELGRLTKELTQLQGDAPLVAPVVNGQAVADVVSAWTGIPVGKMVLDEIKTVMSLSQRLEERVIGQSAALEALAKRIKTARAGLADPRRPIGVFLLVGPSGVGKTETAMALADILYGGDRNMVIINMSEYKESSKVSNLTGSAKGLVGYGEGGVLTEAVRRKPHSVVLLDEVEKAHVDVQELFYQVFDKGMLQDSSGNDVNFKNTIILLTSNAGTDTVMKLCADPETCPEGPALAEALRPDLLKAFKPALLGRMTVLPYFPLSDDVVRQIVRLQLSRITARVRENHKATLTYDDALVDAIAARCKEVESGARNVDQIITGTLLSELSHEFLTHMGEGHPISSVRVGVADGGRFTYDIK